MLSKCLVPDRLLMGRGGGEWDRAVSCSAWDHSVNLLVLPMDTVLGLSHTLRCALKYVGGRAGLQVTDELLTRVSLSSSAGAENQP